MSRVAVEDGCVHRLRRPCWVEVLAQERDLAPSSTQEHHVLLTVQTPGCLDPALALDLRDGRLRVGEGLDAHVEKAEVLDGSNEPSRELHDLRASRHARRMADCRRERQFPYDIIGEHRLPTRVVGDERLDVSVQQVFGDGHAAPLDAPDVPLPTPPAVSRATASVATLCPSRWSASAP